MVSTVSLLSRLALAATFLLGVALAPEPASAKKKPKPEEPVVVEDSPEMVFAKSFIGKTYDDNLDVEGWEDAGGGLVSPPIYVHEYRRDDGTVMVLTAKETTAAKGDTPGTYQVLDAVIMGKPRKDAVFSIACVQGADQTLRFPRRGLGQRPEGMVDRRAPRLGDLPRDRSDRLDPAERRQMHQPDVLRAASFCIVMPGLEPGIQGQQARSKRPLDRRVKPGDDEVSCSGGNNGVEQWGRA